MTLTTHRIVELLTGIALFAIPFVVASMSTSVEGAGLVVSFVLGALYVGAALTAGPRAMAHENMDRVLTAAGGFAAAGLALAGEDVAALCCLVAALVELVLLLRTRYVVRP